MGNGIRIRSGSEETGEKKRPLAALLFLYAGVCGTMSFLHSLEGVSFSGWVVYVIAAVLCGVIWYTCYGRKKAFLLLALVSVVICQTAVFLIGDTFREQAAHIVECITDGGDTEPMSVMETAILLTVVVSFIMAVSELLIKSHLVLYLLTTGLLLLSPLWGVRAGVGEILLVALFQAAFWAMKIAELVHKRGVFRGKRNLSGKSSITTGLILVAVFLAVFPLVAAHTEELYGFVYDAEGEAYRTMSRLSGKADELVTGGKIGRGNNYRTGTAHLELVTTAEPSETLYLRGFGGGEYTGGDWIRSSDEALFANIMARPDWQDNEISIANRYYGMYFVMNGSMQGNEDELPETVTLTIRHCNGVYGNAYVPYYRQRSNSWYNYDDYYGYGSQREGYVYRYYEQKDMMIDWENVSEAFEEQRDWYRRLQNAYVEEIQTAYTQVPEALLPRLTKLCQENPQKTLDEITAFILYTLHSNASYTLTPGWAPMNEDIVEYFLFEGGRGYCEHFAVTATLMYRLYGIPARYATGYMLAPSDFEVQEDSTWKAVATDESAHAWVEIFLEDYGWTPVEVTPASDGGSVASYPGFDRSVLGRIMRERNWSMDRPGIPLLRVKSGQGNEGQDEGFTFDFEIDYEEHERWFYVLGTCVVYSLCLVPLFLDYRRLRRLRKMEEMGCRKVFSRVLQILRLAGIMEGYDGMEEDFAEKLAGLTGVAREEIAQMQKIVCEAAYGSVPPMPEKEECVRKTYLHLAEAVYGTLKWHRKIMMRKVKALI